MTDSEKKVGLTLSSVLGVAWKSAAVGIALVAVAIAVIPSILYTPLPADLTLDFTKPTTMIVTGANSGLGLATVQNFAHNERATIIMACRSMTRCETAKRQIIDRLGGNVVQADLRPMLLDLSQKSSVEAFAKELRGQPIDILIHNAGLAGVTPDLVYHQQDGVENHIRVNHLGPFYLTHCLWKNLRMADRARVIMVSSVLAGPKANSPTFGWYKGEERFTKSWNVRMYGCSKRANLFFANELHHRFRETTSVSVAAAHPGFTQTDLCKNGCKGKNKIGRFFSNLQLLTGTIKMTAEEGSLSQAYAAVLPQAGVYVGPSLLLVGEPKILGTLDNSWHHMAFTRDESKYLWDKSMQAMGVKVFGDYEIPVERLEEPEPEVTVEDNERGVGEAEDGFVTGDAPPVETADRSDEAARVVDGEDSRDGEEDDDEADEVWNTYLGDGDYIGAVMM